jgi:hypothetical protein
MTNLNITDFDISVLLGLATSCSSFSNLPFEKERRILSLCTVCVKLSKEQQRRNISRWQKVKMK